MLDFNSKCKFYNKKYDFSRINKKDSKVLFQHSICSNIKSNQTSIKCSNIIIKLYIDLIEKSKNKNKELYFLLNDRIYK